MYKEKKARLTDIDTKDRGQSEGKDRKDLGEYTQEGNRKGRKQGRQDRQKKQVWKGQLVEVKEKSARAVRPSLGSKKTGKEERKEARKPGG